MRQVFDRIDRIAPTNVNVLILGETGTGKELVAREIHKRSERSNGPFIAINCRCAPQNLMESEIFGHVKGAFTGAVANKKGCFELANGGTLFLDEIGEMSAKLQVKLLRAIQERQITQVATPILDKLTYAYSRQPTSTFKRQLNRIDSVKTFFIASTSSVYNYLRLENAKDVISIAQHLLESI